MTTSMPHKPEMNFETQGWRQDEACTSLAGALLYHGGFHSLQLQRVSHAMWQAGQKTSAIRIQACASANALNAVN